MHDRLRRPIRRPATAPAPWRRLPAADGGATAVEFAIIAPVLVLGLLATADLGFALSHRMALDHVLRTAAQHATSDPGSTDVEAVMYATVAAEAPAGAGPASMTASRNAACAESLGTPVPVSTTCAGEAPTLIFYTLAAEQTYDGILLPDMRLSSSLQVRIR